MPESETAPVVEPDVGTSQLCAYLNHFLGYFPSAPRKRFNVHQIEALDMDGWSDDERKLVVEEGRLQIERQQRDLEQVRTRAQFMVTTGLLLMVGVIAVHGWVVGDAVANVFWWVGAVLTTTAIFGLGAVSVSAKQLTAIDAALLTHSASPVLNDLAQGYARAVRMGEDTLATELTVLRFDVLLLLGGLALTGIGLLCI